jgi:hypothetical protein
MTSVIENNGIIGQLLGSVAGDCILRSFIIQPSCLTVEREVLGQGGEATVVRGILHPPDGERREVAVKCFPLGDAGSSASRGFQSEVRGISSQHDGEGGVD